MLKAILVDDDSSNLSSLTEKLKRHCPQVSIVAACENAREGIQSINSLKPDLVFLDIEMPVLNGFALLQEVIFREFELIFVTAYDHYAIKAIRYSALDYLVKPVDVEELKLAVERAEKSKLKTRGLEQMDLLLEFIDKKSLKRIPIPTNEGLQFIELSEIEYLEASNNYTIIYLAGFHKYVVCRTLGEFEDLLPNNMFIRIHHSCIINKNLVEKYIRGEGGQVVMKNGTVLDVSKRKKAEFLASISKT